jgi:hypothetical protein
MKKGDTEALSDAITRVRRVCQRLLVADVLNPAELDNGTMPEARGIYLWRYKENQLAAYLGVALGKRGLKGRIIDQHLRPTYEQSVFRKAIVRSFGVNSREGSVEYIKKHFAISLAACPDQDPAVIFAAEAVLLTALRPEFNKIKGIIAEIQDG